MTCHQYKAFRNPLFEGSATWKEGINKFSAYTREEMKAYKGRSKNHAKLHSPRFEVSLPADFKLRPVDELPASVDWRNVDNVVSAVKDQGYCGSCWAFASAATLESHLALQTGLLFDLSPQQIAMCTPNPEQCGGSGGCQGATAELAFDYIASYGVLEEYQYGYSAYYGQNAECNTNNGTPVASIQGYVRLPENNYTALMNVVASVGPVAVSVDAAWGAYESGIFNGCNQENPDIDHAVVLVGYGEDSSNNKYWIVRNSWSPSWGEQGYIRLARFDNEDEICGMDITPQDGTACEGDDEPVRVCGTCGILYDSSYPSGVAQG